MSQPNPEHSAANPADAGQPGAAQPSLGQPNASLGNPSQAVAAQPNPAQAEVAQPNAPQIPAEAQAEQAVVKPNVDRLQMIQGIITRLAANSGALKGFAVPVVTALLGVAVDKSSAGFAWLAIYPIVVFGFLDAYYLALEKRYRALYNRAYQQSPAEWSLAAGQASWQEILDSWRSPSVWAFYGAALVVVIIVALIL